MTSDVHENGYESECSTSTRSEEDIARSALEVEADTFTRFIERQRVEVMFELRNIRLGERPVTGQANREQIQTFLNRVQEQQQQPQPRRIPSTRPVVPSAHIADIDALANRRCVSAALGSAAFRRDLENVVRNTIDRQVATPVLRTQQTSPVQQIPQAPPIPRTLTRQTIETQNLPNNAETERPQITQTETQEPFSVERYCNPTIYFHLLNYLLI